jgi:HSP20 family molecular chaperone IbpA
VGDVTDCLSEAYDCVSHLIGTQPVQNGVRVSRGFQDCRKAREKWMPWLVVDFSESERFVYALASVPGYAGRDVSVGLEPLWLAILAQREKDDPRDANVTENSAWNSGKACSAAENAALVQTFCVMSLPAEINPVDSIAVLAKGILGIRMPKARA